LKKKRATRNDTKMTIATARQGRKEVWVVFPEISAEEIWEAMARFCQASSYEWARYTIMLRGWKKKQRWGPYTILAPTAHRTEIIPKPLDRFVESVISPTTLFTTP